MEGFESYTHIFDDIDQYYRTIDANDIGIFSRLTGPNASKFKQGVILSFNIPNQNLTSTDTIFKLTIFYKDESDKDLALQILNDIIAGKYEL